MRSRSIRVALATLTGGVLLATTLVAQGALTADPDRPAIRLARLTGEVEVPTGDLDGTGLATVIVDPGKGQLCFAVVVDHITLPAIMAHVHVGAPGVAGPIVVPITPPDATGTSAGCVTGVDHDLLRAIRSHPRRYYVNVHTTDFPAGAVRGQLHRP